MPDAAPSISREASTLEAAWTIAVRELVAFFRQRSRVLAAIITPLFLWLMLGMGMHVNPRDMFDSDDVGDRREAISQFGPRIHTVTEPANMIAVTDSFIDVNNDPWATPLAAYPFAHPGGYFDGQANFAFLDGHVEAQRVNDYTFINDSESGPGNDWQNETNDPARKARMRRWNNDGKPHVQYWQ